MPCYIYHTSFDSRKSALVKLPELFPRFELAPSRPPDRRVGLHFGAVLLCSSKGRIGKVPHAVPEAGYHDFDFWFLNLYCC